MRRLHIIIALATLSLASIASAQQASSNTPSNSERQGSPTPPPGPILGGMGTTNYIPIWAASSFLLDSIIYQTSGGDVGVGTTSPAAKLDVNGAINTSQTYQVEGSNVVNIGSPADQNLFLGVGTGVNDVAGQGVNNVFSGWQAGHDNTTGQENTFSGWDAGSDNTMGSANTFSGWSAGSANFSGSSNSFYGVSAGGGNGNGSYNTYSGVYAGFGGNSGNYNTFFGYKSGYNSGGSYNTFIGSYAGENSVSGSSNVYIANQGSTQAETNTIRIGTHGTGNGQQTLAYIAGIYGSMVDHNGIPVYVDDNGQLGTVVSSLRFKEQVHDMGDSTNALMKLRPVTFFYKPEYSKGDRTLQYGLIAEEVAQVYPELVAYDNDGQPYSVRYQYITTMLLNEVQKQYRRAEEEAKVVTTQQQKIDELEQRLSRLESLIGSAVKTAQENMPIVASAGGAK